MSRQSRFILTITLLLFSANALAEGRAAPDITAEQWLNTKPLTMDSLKGQVVLVEFWTYGCWNCTNVEPYIKRWHETYAPQGLIVLAVHSPEFQHERDIDNVRRYIGENAITYPVAIDNDFSTWKAFGNRAWPTVYLINKAGHVVYSHVGEGAYQRTEAKIRQLLAEGL